MGEARYERCDTFDCERMAEYTARWTFPGPGGGRYCEECAERLERGGDSVEPPILHEPRECE